MMMISEFQAQDREKRVLCDTMLLWVVSFTIKRTTWSSQHFLPQNKKTADEGQAERFNDY